MRCIDCTGLSGHDLEGPDPYYICIRSDKHNQGVYGPSVAPLESIRNDYRSKRTVALHLTKAMHEFVVLHYLAMDACRMGIGFVVTCAEPRS